MSNDFDIKIDEKELADSVFKTICPALITLLLEKKLLDTTRLEDKDYVFSMIGENLDLVEKVALHVNTQDELLKSFRSELNAGRDESAIIMLAVSIERILNMFYQHLLPAKYEMDYKEVSNALSRLRLSDKITWFLLISAKWKLPLNLVAQIRLINSIRNEIIHYKAIPEDLDKEGTGTYNDIKGKLTKLKLDGLENVTFLLKDELDRALIEAFPNIGLANEISKILF